MTEQIVPDKPRSPQSTPDFVEEAPSETRAKRGDVGIFAADREFTRSRYANSATLSLAHLLVLLSLEASYERMVGQRVGLVGTLGAGTLPSVFGLRRSPGLDLQEVGGQIRYYVGRNGYWNQHIGVEGFWGRADYRHDLSEEDGWLILDFSNVWTAWGGGPFVGTKFLNRDGLVFELQLGVQRVRITDKGGSIDHQIWPIINVSAGKGF